MKHSTKNTFATSLLLKNKQELFNAAHTPHHWNRIAAELLLVAVLGAALFGVIMATHAPSLQHVAEFAWKMIVLIWGPIALCTPSLFVFAAIRGSRIQLNELVYLLLGSVATIGIVLLALTPIVWFFTWSTETLDFVRAMNVIAIGLSMTFGLFYLAKGMVAVHKLDQQRSTTTSASKKEDKDGQEESETTAHAATDILALWFILLIVVTLQMADKLGPWYS